MRTPEPVGVMELSDPDDLRFVVQRHGAGRMHYDLRLEWDGALMSWAVPEGPSVNTADRRFAIRTEDHPVAYLEFRGTIPKDEYGGGEIDVWDRGIWVPVTGPPGDALEAGELKFRLFGEKLRGGWTLVRLNKSETEFLLIKERDEGARKADILAEAPAPVLKRTRPKIAGRKAGFPTTLKPELATEAAGPPEGASWLHEIKYDGYRTLLKIEGGHVTALTRNGHDWTKRYGSVVAAAVDLDCTSAVIDGEVVVQDARGAASFELLQQALSEGRDHELAYFPFDLLYLDGRDLRSEPTTVRKALLRRLVPFCETNRIQYSDHVVGDGREFFAQVCRLGLEGIVSKRADAPYRMQRTRDWIKSKRYEVGRFSVVGFTTKSSSHHVASLMLAEEAGGAYVGRVSAGLTNDWAAELFRMLSDLETETPSAGAPKPPGGHWVPAGKVQAEVTYRARTDSGALRQASLLSVNSVEPGRRASPPKRKLVSDQDLASIRLTNPDREIFVGSGMRKIDVALYYARVGDVMLPHLLDRPVTLIRCTTGRIEDCFYQRHAMQGMPEGVDAVASPEKGEFLVIRDARGFLGLTQFGTIEFHPWDCRADRLDRPDRFTIDLDPDEALEWPSVASAAFAIRERLVEMDFTPFVRTTGGKGLHIVVPLTGRQAWSPVKAFLKAFAKSLVSDAPRLFTTSSSKAHRKGRIFVDMGRTALGSSATASYSLRARPTFPVAVPLAWSELQQLSKRPEFNSKTAVNRVENAFVDPWEDFERVRAGVNQKARRAVGLRS